MMVADKMSNRPIRPNGLIGLIRLIIYPKNKKKMRPRRVALFVALLGSQSCITRANFRLAQTRKPQFTEA